MFEKMLSFDHHNSSPYSLSIIEITFYILRSTSLSLNKNNVCFEKINSAYVLIHIKIQESKIHIEC